MGRIVEILVGINALGGIAVFLGFRHAGRKAKEKVLRGLGRDDPPENKDPGSPLT